MNILITQRVVKTKYGVLRDALEHTYIKYYEQFGINIIPLPNVLINLEQYIKDLNISAIIFSGGNDIDSRLYQGNIKTSIDVSKERDTTEIKLLKLAEQENIPCLFECRGCQLLNIYFSGKIRDLRNEEKVLSHVTQTHEVNLVDNRIINFLNLNKLEVNSYHNFGILKDDVSSQLKVFAQSSDGVIEGIYHPSKPFVGIMWHPERDPIDDKLNKKLIEAFINKQLYWENNDI